MKVFVWAEDYGDCISDIRAIAFANSVEEARDYLRKKGATLNVDMTFLESEPILKVAPPKNTFALLREPARLAEYGEDAMTIV